MNDKYTIKLKHYNEKESFTKEMEGTYADLKEIIYSEMKNGNYHQSILKNGESFELISDEKVPTIYLLSLLFLEDNDLSFGNKHIYRHFNSLEAAQEYFELNWFSMHEHWVNTVCIEEITGFQYKKTKRTWFKSEDMLKQIPKEIDEPVIFKNISCVGY